MQETHDTAALAKTKILVDRIKFCMLTTLTPEGALVSRPMTTMDMDASGNLWFFTSTNSDIAMTLDFESNVNLAYADPADANYLSISGVAEVTRDREKMAQFWSPLVAAWFPDGLDDPLLCLIRVRPVTAEYWDSPSSKVVRLLGMAKAILTGTRYDGPGEHGKMERH